MSIVNKVTVGVSIASKTVELRVECEGSLAFANLTMSPEYALGLAKELVAASERATALISPSERQNK